MLETVLSLCSISFDISPLSPQQIAFFGYPEVRRAFDMCIDRDLLIGEFGFPEDVLLDTYVPKKHPLALSEIENTKYSPEDASAILNSIGWIDHDNNPDTPRRATRVPGIPDGIDFVVTYLVPNDQHQMDVARRIAEMVYSCGIEMHVEAFPWEQLLAVGPEGKVFGRKFDLVQFAWATTIEPSCMLYESDEIPGSYPEYLKGWGGGNATGFSNERYDMACMKARNTLEGLPAYEEYHHTAQEIFAEEVPAIPLYLNCRIVAAKAGLCGLERVQYGFALFYNLEEFDDSKQCKE
jgi:ABC-type transport system substrate-binding protein